MEYNIPLDKKSVSLISVSVLIIFTLGVTIDNKDSISQNSQKILIHESAEIPHTAQEKTNQYMEKYINTHIQTDADSRRYLDEKFDRFEDKLDQLLIFTCSNPNNGCN